MAILLAETITISTEAMVVVGTVVAALVSGITYLFFMVTNNRSAEITSLKEMYERRLALADSDKKSWQEMAQELGINIEKAVNRKRLSEGLPPFKIMEPVIPEHSSPVTLQQQQTADISTMRARLVAATEELNLPARTSSEPSDTPTAIAMGEATALHTDTKNQLDNATAKDAMSDAVGAIGVASVAVDTAADIVNKNEQNKNVPDQSPDNPK